VREERVSLEVILGGVEPAEEHHGQAPRAVGEFGRFVGRGRGEIVVLGRPGPEMGSEPAAGLLRQVSQHDLDPDLGPPARL